MKDQHKTYSVIRNLVQFFKNQEEKPSADEINDAWDAVSQKIKEENQIRRRRSLTWMSASAAAVILVAFIVGVTMRFSTSDDLGRIASELAQITAEDGEIKLIVSSDKVVEVKENATVTYSPDGSIMVDEEKIVSQKSRKEDSDNEYNQLIVPKGKYTQLQLSDGSIIHVNSGTKLVYPRTFSKNRREIFVDGETFIKVIRNESAPFIVKTENFEVEVLGTSFNINAYSEDSVAEVVLVDGSINLKDKSKNNIKMSPNELVAIHTGKIHNKKEVDVFNYISWTEGLLALNATPLGSVLQRLKRYYGTEITFDPSVQNLAMYGNLDLNHPLDEILQRLSITAPISYQRTESGFYIKRREK